MDFDLEVLLLRRVFGWTVSQVKPVGQEILG